MNKPLCVLLATLTTPVMGINIELDFSHDEAANRFFSSNPTAQAAVEKAAQDLGAAVASSMTEISTDVYSGTNGSTTASFDWSWSYTNPVTGSIETIQQPRMDANTIRIYIGTRRLSGSILGEGGAGGAGILPSGSGIPSEWIGAVALAEANSNAAMRRGNGPIFGTLSGALNVGGYIGNYNLDYGSTVGNLWIDVDTDNNGLIDSNGTLSDFWHYDAYSDVAAGKTDLYSVVLHEMMHVLGVGTSQTWQDMHNNNQWLGHEAALVAGTNTLIDSDGYHALNGLMSTRISDNVFQEAVIAPTIIPGIRKELTELDLAFLSDIGFTSVRPVPEPSVLGTLMIAGLLMTWCRTKP